MPNETITNVDLGTVEFGGDITHEDAPVKFTGAATYAAGTIMARDTGDLTLIAFVKGGATAGNGIPAAVLTYDIVATGAGNIQSRALVGGGVRKERLIILADGDSSNVDAAVRDQLRARSIVATNSTELGRLDNQ